MHPAADKAWRQPALCLLGKQLTVKKILVRPALEQVGSAPFKNRFPFIQKGGTTLLDVFTV